MRKPWFLLLVLLALVGAACGGDDGGTEASGTTDDTEAEEPADDADDEEVDVEAEASDVATPAFLRTAAQTTTEAGTGRMEMVFELSGMPGAEGGVTMTGAGSYDTEAQLAEITLDMSSLFESLGASSPEQRAQFEQVFGDGTFSVITEGTTVYMNMPFLAQLFGSDAEWIMMDASAAAGGGGIPGVGTVGTGSPAAMLESLRGVSDEIEKVGTEDVRGVSTVHLKGTLNMQKAVEQVPEAQREQVESALAQFGSAAEDVPYEVFVDDDNLVRRFVMDFSGLTGAAAQGATGSVSMDFFDFGTPVEIVIPPADQVFDATEQMAGLGTGASAPGA